VNFKELTYDQFWMERLSWKAEEKGIAFTKEEIQWAVYQTEYKYFGDYEFSDQQRMAVDILVWAAEQQIGKIV